VVGTWAFSARILFLRSRKNSTRPARARRPSGTPAAAPVIVLVLFFLLLSEPGVADADEDELMDWEEVVGDVKGDWVVNEAGVEDGEEVGEDVADAATGSAKIVPKAGV